MEPVSERGVSVFPMHTSDLAGRKNRHEKKGDSLTDETNPMQARVVRLPSNSPIMTLITQGATVEIDPDR